MPPIRPDFLRWTLQDAQQAIAAGIDRSTIGINRAFLDGDHWQNAAGWIGPRPPPEDENFQEFMRLIETSFVSKNVLDEVVSRHVAGVVGREPTWGFSPRRAVPEGEKITDAEKKLVDESEAFVTEWWDKRGIHQKIKDATRSLLASKRVVLRFFVPAGVRELVPGPDGVQRGVLRATDIAAALDMIYLDVIEAENGAVVMDAGTQRKVGVVIYKIGVGGEEEVEQVEMSWVTPQGNTVLRIIREDLRGGAPYNFTLGGRILMHELSRMAFVTEQMRQQQKAINLAHTISPRAITTSGFMERVFLNAQSPGTWVETADGKRKEFKPSPYHAGPEIANFLRGFDWVDEKGDRQITTPSVNFRPPISPEGTWKSAAEHYGALLEECDQSHVLITGEATPSGRSRREARADYASSLNDTALVLEASGRWLIETALAFAEALSGKPGQYSNDLRATFTPSIDTGPPDPTERQTDETSVKSGIMSRPTAIERAGIVDVAAEMARIDAQPEARLNRLSLQAEVMGKLALAGIDVEAAAELVELSPEQLTIVKRGVQQGGFEPPPQGDDAAGDQPGRPPLRRVQ